MKIIYFGTPFFAAKVLDFLISHKIDIRAVITKPDRPQGRSAIAIPTSVKLKAIQHAIPFFQPELVSALDFASTLQQFAADLFVVVAYGEIIKQHLLDMPKIACINLHASLLPLYRGAAPIQHSIINGEKITGTTIIYMTKKMDAGDIIATKEVDITDNMTFGALEERLCETGSELLLQTLVNFEQNIFSRTPQDHSKATFAPKIELEDCQINWNLSAQRLHNLIRGVHPHPGAWCYVTLKGQKKRFKILKAQLIDELIQEAPGKIISMSKENFVVGCGKGALALLSMQLEGKKIVTNEEFVKGFKLEDISFHSDFNS